MEDVCGGEVAGGGGDGAAGRARADLLTDGVEFLEDGGAAGAVDGAVDAASGAEGGVGGVADGVSREGGDVSLHQSEETAVRKEMLHWKRG